MILQTLYQTCVKLVIEFFNEFYVLDLVMTEYNGEQRPSAVVAFELATGDIHVFQGKSIVFATGGFGKIYKTTSNAHTLTGDGVGIIWRKGLPLEDMSLTSSTQPVLLALASCFPKLLEVREESFATHRVRRAHGAPRADD